jgi:hypothetical protein
VLSSAQSCCCQTRRLKWKRKAARAKRKGREDSAEPAFHFFEAGDFRFAEAEELAVVAADDGQEFLFLPLTRLAQENHNLAPVERFGSARRGRAGHANVPPLSGLALTAMMRRH